MSSGGNCSAEESKVDDEDDELEAISGEEVSEWVNRAHSES